MDRAGSPRRARWRRGRGVAPAPAGGAPETPSGTMMATTSAAMICSEVRQPWTPTSHAASGDMVIGAMPMPADTSDTARLRRVSNHPVTQAIIGAKIAAALAPTSTPNSSWNAASDVRQAGQRETGGQQQGASQHDDARAKAVGEVAPGDAARAPARRRRTSSRWRSPWWTSPCPARSAAATPAAKTARRSPRSRARRPRPR